MVHVVARVRHNWVTFTSLQLLLNNTRFSFLNFLIKINQILLSAVRWSHLVPISKSLLLNHQGFCELLVGSMKLLMVGGNWQIPQKLANTTNEGLPHFFEKLFIMQLPIFMFQGKRWESRKNKFSQLPSVRLAALFLSYFVVTKIWNNRLITAQAGRISQLLSCLSRDSKQDWLQLKHLLLNIQRIVHSPRQLLAPILYFPTPLLGSALCRMGLVSATNQEREYKWVCTQGRLTVASYITTGSIAHVFPIILSVLIRRIYV